MLALAPFLQEAKRRDVSERGVTTIAIVERFDVLEHFSTGFSPGTVAPTMNAFVLQTVEKALRGRVVPAVRFATHRAMHAITGQFVLKGCTGVLHTAIRVMNQPGLRVAPGASR